MKRIQVHSDVDKATTLTEQKKAGLYLVEVQDHADGAYLIFDTMPQKETVTLEQRIAKLEGQVKSLAKS